MNIIQYFSALSNRLIEHIFKISDHNKQICRGQWKTIIRSKKGQNYQTCGSSGRSIAGALRGTRLSGSYMNARQENSRGTIPFLRQSISSRPQTADEYRQNEQVRSSSSFLRCFIYVTIPFSQSCSIDAIPKAGLTGFRISRSVFVKRMNYLFERTSASYFLTSLSHSSRTGTFSVSQ